MSKTRIAALGAVGAVALLSLTACGGEGGDTAGPEGAGQTLNVWIIQDTLLPETQQELVEAFEEETGATLNIEIQQWDQINTKMTAALATDTPPDVVEIGNTNVPLYAANGALADLSDIKGEIGDGGTLLTGLIGPATVGDKVYAAPFYGGSRGVIYNTELWAAAGVDGPPADYAEFTADLDKVAATSDAPDFSPIYMPGTLWYAGFSWVMDTGAQIAELDGDTWNSGLDSAEAVEGLAQYQEFQNAYSTEASRTAPMDSPDPLAVFGTGKTSAIIANAGAIAKLASTYPELEGKLGAFPIPSANHAGESAPSFLGGSVIAVSAKSQKQELAKEFIEFITSKDVQIEQLAKENGRIPITNEYIDDVLPELTPEQQPFFEAAKNSYATPAAPGWATVETDLSVLDYFSEVASGTSAPEESAANFSAHLEQALNANK
ncbi:extracellular solute-binding protein [Microbacterium tumbae]